MLITFSVGSQGDFCLLSTFLLSVSGEFANTGCRYSRMTFVFQVSPGARHQLFKGGNVGHREYLCCASGCLPVDKMSFVVAIYFFRALNTHQ